MTAFAVVAQVHPVAHQRQRQCCVREQMIGELEWVCKLNLESSQTLHHSYLFLIGRVCAAVCVEWLQGNPKHWLLGRGDICWPCFGKVKAAMSFTISSFVFLRTPS
ncbi:MAG: hypothetical protein CMM05_03650 [Rhodopirellula sp.]|nr:hypothetical protein [Rhodopirellula sp.]